MIKLNNVSLHYGGQDILKNAEMLIRDNDRIGLVGPNGAGKSSLFKLLVKELSPSSGDIITDKKNARIGYFSQNVGEMSGRTVLDEVISGAGRVSEIANRLNELEARMGTGEITDREMDEYGDLQTEFIALDGYNLDVLVKQHPLFHIRNLI